MANAAPASVVCDSAISVLLATLAGQWARMRADSNRRVAMPRRWKSGWTHTRETPVRRLRSRETRGAARTLREREYIDHVGKEHVYSDIS